MGKKYLITGGVRSGKSAYALTLAKEYPSPRLFVATAEAFDEEMKVRIVRHQRERATDFVTVETPLDLIAVFQGSDSHKSSIILVDCITLWLSNLFHYCSKNHEEIQKRCRDLIIFLCESNQNLILVTNEIGLGLMPESSLARRFLDELGFLNQALARLCDEVIVMNCGISQFIKKGTLEHAKVDCSITTH